MTTMRRSVLVLVLLALAQPASADTFDPGVEVTCSPEEFAIESLDMMNYELTRPQKKDSQMFFDYAPHKERCVIRGHTLVATFQIFKPQSGECGAAPGALLTLSIDGKNLLEKTSFNGCFTTLSAVKVNRGWHVGGVQLTLCGHSRVHALPRFDGCVTIDESEFKRMDQALKSGFPLTEVLKRLSF